MLNRKFLAAAMLAGAITIPSLAHAGTCEDTFVKRGSIISGMRFVAMISVNDMPADVAINQMRGIAARKGYDIIAAEPAAGALLIEQSHTGKTRAFPIEINASVANGVGTVQMEAKLRAGMTVKAEDARTEMCAMLAELRGGKEGRLAAKAGSGATTVQAAPIAMTALAFTGQFSKDLERNALAVEPRYKDKRFTLSGTVERVSRDGSDIRVWFEILQPHEMVLRLPGAPKSHVEIGCALGAGQSVFGMQLKPGKSIKLTGTFDDHDEYRKVVWFKDCVPDKK
jgi:hypothetical protein